MNSYSAFNIYMSEKLIALEAVLIDYEICVNISSAKVPNVSAMEDQMKYAWSPLPTRQNMIDSLKNEEFDVLVIGGGATGCGVALDAVSRGHCFF